MHEFIQFLIKHWMLAAAFILVLILLIWEEMKAKGAGGKNVSHSEATHLINRQKAQVVDVRDQASFQAGHVIGALHIPAAELMAQVKKLEKYKKRPLILICANGQKSAQLTSQLRKQGFETAVALTGGIQAWKNAGLPIIIEESKHGKN